MRIFLEPTEPLLFRTGRSFDAGESGFAETLFPPTPETLQGAIRAAIAAYRYPSEALEEAFSHDELTKLIGSRGSGYGRFCITGLAIGKRKDDGTVERLFRPPAHLFTLDITKDSEKLLLLKPQKVKNVMSDLGKEIYYLLSKDQGEEKREPLEGWLTESGLVKVLHSNTPPTGNEIIPDENIFTRESRLGIGMNNATKTTREGFLYQTQVIRMQTGFGFTIDIRLRKPAINPDTPYLESFIDDTQTQQELQLPDQGWLILGGERRTARFEILASAASTLEQKKQGRLLYLATPAAFDGGWQPTPPFDFPIAAAINRYQSIGGWELDPANSGGNNKIMRRCVPAGSIYFFEQAVTVTQPLTDHGIEIGYGITYTGEWQQ